MPAQQVEALFRVYGKQTRGATVTVGELLKDLRELTYGSGNRTIATLVNAAYLRKERAAHDARVVFLELTPYGRKLVEQMLETFDCP